MLQIDLVALAWATAAVVDLKLKNVIFEFSSAEAFLRSDELSATRCLIADVQMPGMDGMELQRRLNEAGTALPMIFITAFPDQRVLARVLSAGALGCLSKPFDEASLIRHIESALARRPS